MQSLQCSECLQKDTYCVTPLLDSYFVVLQFLFNTHIFFDLLHGCVDEGGEGGDLGDALRLEALHLQFLKHVHVTRQTGVLVL